MIVFCTTRNRIVHSLMLPLRMRSNKQTNTLLVVQTLYLIVSKFEQFFGGGIRDTNRLGWLNSALAPPTLLGSNTHKHRHQTLSHKHTHTNTPKKWRFNLLLREPLSGQSSQQQTQNPNTVTEHYRTDEQQQQLQNNATDELFWSTTKTITFT